MATSVLRPSPSAAITRRGTAVVSVTLCFAMMMCKHTGSADPPNNPFWTALKRLLPFRRSQGLRALAGAKQLMVGQSAE